MKKGWAEMLGMGKRHRRGSSDDGPERALFRELGAKRPLAEGRRRRRTPLWVGLGALALIVGATIVPLAASSTTNIVGFELDGNTEVNTTAEDWNSLFGATGNSVGGSALSKFWASDGTGDGDTGFGSGQTKDTADVSQWTWKTGTVTPPKDNISFAYAANYVEQGNQILYFGQERAFDDKGGDANVGFWFLQDPDVSLNPDGTFDGTHLDGDLLVQSEFTNGGAIAGIRVYKWQNGGVVEVGGLNESACTGGVLGLKDACAITNAAQITTPWSAPGAPYFFEGGINLSAIYSGGALPCFSSFLTNTRTSQAPNADLKDFAFGGLDTCGSITIHKDAKPDDASVPFPFTTTGGLSPATFDLTDPGNNTKSFSKLGAGSYSVTEGTLPGGWSLTNLTCTSAGSGTSTSRNGATITITLGIAGHVDCIYENTFSKQNTSTVTTPKQSGQPASTIALGESITDYATVTGNAIGGTPTGTVSFFVCGPDTGICTSGGTAVGGAVALSPIAASNPPAAEATSASFTPTAAGEWCFRGVYTPGGANGSKYNGSSDSAQSECFTVTKKSPSISTEASANVTLGADGTVALTDTATLAGATSNASGSITFDLYSDDECEDKVGSVEKTGVSGNGAYVSPAITVNAAGHYYWIASYSGDASNNPASGACGDVNEDVVVSPRSPTLTTEASADVALGEGGNDLFDTATLSGATSNAGGTITFDLYSDDQCENKVGSVEKDVDGNGTYQSPVVHVDAAGHYYWIANYSGDANNTATENGCGEANEDVIVSAPGINIEKTPESQTLRVGDTAEFTLMVTNTGDVPLTDIVVNDADCDAPPVYLSGDAGNDGILGLTEVWIYECSTSEVEESFTNETDVKGTPPVGPDVTDDDTAEVVVINPAIEVLKTPDNQTVQTGSTVTFTIKVTNIGDVDLTDVQVTDAQAPGCDKAIGDLAKGASTTYQCALANVTTDFTNVADVTGTPPVGPPVTDTDDATVAVTPPPPPPPYVPHADITVTKAATPSVVLPAGGGSAPITYNLVVSNNGPDAAANVKVGDAAPVDVTFVSATTAAGTCTVSPQALDCSLGTINSGGSVAITVNATVNASGTKVNVVTVTTSTPETNANNNTAQAPTLVTAPVTPPKPPVVSPEICNTVTVTPKVLKGNGKTQKISIKVTKGKTKKGVSGVTVKVTGPGISKTAKTGKNGKVTLTFKPTQPGIIRVEVQGAKACNTQRIGVVGVFEPPVTG